MRSRFTAAGAALLVVVGSLATVVAAAPAQAQPGDVPVVDGRPLGATGDEFVVQGDHLDAPIVPLSSHPTCTATYAIMVVWTGGFQTTVTVTAGTTAISTWTAEWTFGHGETITALWSGVPTVSMADITVANAPWNGALDPGDSTTFGFNGAWINSTSVPALTCTAT